MSTVLNRTTKQVLRSVNTPDYPVEDWIINPDLSGVEGVEPAYWIIEGDTVHEADQSEKDAIDLARLPELKAAKCAQINRRTKELEELGFEYPPGSGNRIPLDSDTRINVAQMKNDSASIPFPFEFNTMDDSDVVVIADAAEMEQFYGAGLTAYLTLKVSGTQLKTLVRAATTKAEVDAVVDHR